MRKRIMYGAAGAVFAAVLGLSVYHAAPGVSQPAEAGEEAVLEKEERGPENLVQEPGQAESQEMEARDDTVTVTADVLRYRSSPTTGENNIKGTVARGKVLKRTGKSAQWSRVQVGGGEYYVSSAYLKEGGTLAEAGTGSASAEKDAGGPASAASGEQGAGDSQKNEAASGGEIAFDASLPYASFSKINSGKAVLYKSTAASRKNRTIGINAGHGTKGGGSVKTLCHPDGSPKVTGGSTASGATTATAVASGMTFSDGTPEATVTLKMANLLKGRLLAEGYDVLMIRDGEDVQLDNIARTVMANNYADCHIALHWDSTSSDKGCFFMSVPNNSSYRSMEPVASHWQDHNRLGEALVEGLRGAGNKIFSGGAMEMDLTQTSYSTVPSVDIELGDKASSYSDASLNKLADGLVAGIRAFYGD